MKIHKDVEKGNFVIYLIRPELMLKEKSDLWVINSMKIGVEPPATPTIDHDNVRGQTYYS